MHHTSLPCYLGDRTLRSPGSLRASRRGSCTEPPRERPGARGIEQRTSCYSVRLVNGWRRAGSNQQYSNHSLQRRELVQRRPLGCREMLPGAHGLYPVLACVDDRCNAMWRDDVGSAPCSPCSTGRRARDPGAVVALDPTAGAGAASSFARRGF